jgi:sulfur-carrier protein
MITIQLRYFASIREALGEGAMLSVAQGSTVAQVRALLQTHSSAHAQALASTKVLRCALNQVLCDETAVLHDGAELAFFPPVTGG